MAFNTRYQTGYPPGPAPAPAARPNELPRMAALTTAENPWPVSMVSQKFHSAVERWPAVWMEGQI
ncbi:exodeoxyribonuclease VII large subunit, partial [Bifidobacterium animalis]|nr:exodeoxyribonuclease VII large subunit [Bifidobacterium animalis]